MPPGPAVALESDLGCGRPVSAALFAVLESVPSTMGLPVEVDVAAVHAHSRIAGGDVAAAQRIVVVGPPPIPEQEYDYDDRDHEYLFRHTVLVELRRELSVWARAVVAF